MKKKGLNLINVFLMFALIPLGVGAILLAIISTNMMSNNLEENTFEELKLAAQGLRSYYEYDLNSGNMLEDGFCEYNPEEYIDVVYNQIGVNLTLFKDDIRFMTSLRNENGSRNEGTKASPEVWAEVRKGNDYSSNDVVIGGKDYFVYYMPLKADGKIVGMAFAGKPATQIQAAERHILLLMCGISALLFVIFAGIAIVLAKKMSDPIKEVADKLQVLSDGNLNVNLEKDSHIRETIILKDSLLQLSGKLTDIINSIDANATNLNTRIAGSTANADKSSTEMNQIADSMNGLAQSTTTLAESVQDINENVGNMGEIVNVTEETVTNLKNSTSKMTTANDNAHKCIDDVIESSEVSAAAVDGITKSIADTNDAVREINEIVNLIQEIANQTNLLALNASIEAARAGESGKGFAVVAEEIGNLATQSKDSTAKIRETVNRINNLSDTCVEQARDVKEIIAAQQNLLKDAMNQFEKLDEEIKESVSNIEAVADTTDKLGNIKDTVLGAVTDLSAISEETSATNEEVTATTETVSTSISSISEDMKEVSGISEELVSVISYFKK